MKNDRFLLGILIGIGLLVALVLGLYFLRQQKPAYLADDTPRGVLHNYVSAIQLKDYELAYSYLADKTDKPAFDTFRLALVTNLSAQDSSVQVGDQFITGTEATVQVTILHYNNSLFGDTYREQQTALLTLQDGQWMLFNGPYPYFNWDWYQPALKQ